MSRLLLITFAYGIAACVASPIPIGHEYAGICSFEFCTCNEDLHPAWTMINCTVPNNLRLDIFPGDLPNTTAELVITGSDGTMFGEGAFANVKDLRQITVQDAKVVVFREFTATGLDVLHLRLDIYNCDVIRFEKNTFIRLGGPLSVNIENSEAIYIEGAAFSWVLDMNIRNVREMRVGSGAFSLEPTATNIGEHGPGMSIELVNMTIAEFPKSAFGSSAARLYMEAVDIHAIRTGAFSANTYNVVIAINCSIHLIEERAFSENSLINYMTLDGVEVQYLTSAGLRSAIENMNITRSRFDNVQTGGINTTTAAVVLIDNTFHTFKEKGFVLSSWNKLYMQRNIFDDLPPNAISAPAASVHELVFIQNEIESVHPGSLGFIGKAAETHDILYYNNFYGMACHCDMDKWIAQVLGSKPRDVYLEESYCTVDELIARCFNTPDQNMYLNKFLKKVCKEDLEIRCEKFRTMTNGVLTEIKNPKFPHNSTTENGLSERNQKVIGIVVVTVLGCIIIALIFSLIKWMDRRGYFFSLKNLIMSSNWGCILCCVRFFNCRRRSRTENTSRPISRTSGNRQSERLCLNDIRPEDAIAETCFQEPISVTTPPAHMPSTAKFTQTLPEEITKDLLQNLKQNLESPDNYAEAREMIEHLYELSKIEDSRPNEVSINIEDDHVYDVPIIDETTPRSGKNNKKSVGTKTPSIEKLLPLTPYYKQPTLVHDYVEPKDAAVHLYTEIANNYRDLVDKRNKLGSMPDVIGDQAVPRGPYLQSILSGPSTSKDGKKSLEIPLSDFNTNKPSSIKSNKSTIVNKMANRPLPKKPIVDPGEGTSAKHG